VGRGIERDKRGGKVEGEERKKGKRTRGKRIQIRKR
jgi:hypothetical protein